jgi:hypothetical protein
LHISLGVFYRLYTLLEESAHKLDLSAAMLAQDGSGGGVSFANYSSALQEMSSLKEQSEKQTQLVTTLEQLSTYLALTLPQDSPALDRVRKEAVAQRKLLHDVVNLWMSVIKRMSQQLLSI